MKRQGIAAIFALVLLVILSGIAMADNAVSATRETQGITTVTHVVVYGTFTDSADVVWQSSNQDLRNNPPLNSYSNEIVQTPTGLQNTNNQDWTPETQATMSYSEQTLADNGYIEWDKTVSLDTGNMVANQDNFKVTTQLDFVSFEDALGGQPSQRACSSMPRAWGPVHPIGTSAPGVQETVVSSRHTATSLKWEAPSPVPVCR